MKNSEIKSLSEVEIREKLQAEQENLQKTKFAHAISPVENPIKIRHSRRLIARLQTALKEKESAK